jgi:hypothetical protein
MPEIASTDGTRSAGPESLAAWPPGGKPDHRRSRIDPTATSPQNLHIPRAQPAQFRACPANLRRGPGSLYRQNHAAGLQQPDRETGQLVQRRYRARGYHVSGEQADDVLGPAPPYPGICQAQDLDAFLKESDSPRHRLQQRDRYARKQHGQHDPRQPGTGSEVNQRARGRH